MIRIPCQRAQILEAAIAYPQHLVLDLLPYSSFAVRRRLGVQRQGLPSRWRFGGDRQEIPGRSR